MNSLFVNFVFSLEALNRYLSTSAYKPTVKHLPETRRYNKSWHSECECLNVCLCSDARCICMQRSTGVHVCSCKRVREVVRVCMPFPVCLCFREESPGKSQRLSPNYLSHWWMVEVWDRVEEGAKKDGESEWWRQGPCKTIPLMLGHS